MMLAMKIKICITLFLLICPLISFAGEQRIISLAPNITEIIFFLGKGDKLVGVTNVDNYPEQVKNIYKIGGFTDPSIEKIIAKKPTHIYTSSSLRHPVSIKLEEMGYQIKDYKARNIKEILFMIEDIAADLGVVDNSRVEDLKRKIKYLEKMKKQSKRVLLLFWKDPLLTVGKYTYLNDIIELAGGVNIFKGTDESYFQVNSEEIMARNPEVALVLMMNSGKNDLSDIPSLSTYLKIKKPIIISDLNPDIFLRAGPRAIDGAKQLYERINGSEKEI